MLNELLVGILDSNFIGSLLRKNIVFARKDPGILPKLPMRKIYFNIIFNWNILFRRPSLNLQYWASSRK